MVGGKAEVTKVEGSEEEVDGGGGIFGAAISVRCDQSAERQIRE